MKSKSGWPPVDARDDGVDRRRGAIGQEHRTGLRANREHVPRAIVFLVGPRLLVLLDQVAIVLVDRKARGHARLHVLAHVQAVDVEARRVFDDERRAALRRREVPRGLLVDLVGVRIGAGGQIDLRPRDVQEAQRVAGGERARFFGVHDVVGHGRRPRQPLSGAGRSAANG